MFKVPNYGRIRKGPMASDESFGNNGVFSFFFNPKVELQCIVSDGLGWEHVSVVAIINGGKQMRLPYWSEMCKIKEKFWDDEDTVFQYHPPKSQYVNNHEFCLHLWRKEGVDMETPPIELVQI